MIDLLVAGGGPVGLAAAIRARLAGLEVVVLEPRRGVLDKACGEGLMPGALAELAAMGVHVEAQRAFVGIRYVEGARSVEARLPAPGAGVRRLALHEALVARARALGVQWRAQRASHPRICEAHVELAGLQARHAIAADGLHSPIRRALGLALPPRRAARLGVRRHFACAPWTDHVEVHLVPGVEAYVTPVSETEVGLAFLYDGREVLGEGRLEPLLSRFPVLEARLQGAEPLSSERGSGPFEQRTRSSGAGRVLLAGDAAGYLDPLTGEGLHLGLVSARLAVEAIASGRSERYPARLRRAARASWWLTDGLLRVRQGRHAAPLLMPALRWVPGLFPLALRLLAGEAAPADPGSR